MKKAVVWFLLLVVIYSLGIDAVKKLKPKPKPAKLEDPLDIDDYDEPLDIAVHPSPVLLPLSLCHIRHV